MKRSEIVDYIHENSKFLLRKAKYGYVCPVCLNGSGKDGTGLYTKNDVCFVCYKCGAKGDLFDLIGEKYEVKSFKEKINCLCDEYNIILED